MKNEPLSPALSPGEARLGWCWMALQYLLLPQLLSLAAGLFFPAVSDSFVNFLYHLTSFLGVFLIFRVYLRDSFRWAAAHGKRCVRVCALALAVYYAATWAVTMAIRQLESAFSNRNDAAILRYFGESFPLTALVTILLAPMTEEMLFRGLLFSGLRSKNRWGAYAVSCLCFASIHVAGYLGTYSPLQFSLALAQYLPAGLILAYSEEKSQTILVPIVIHMVINGISLVSIL